MFEDVPFRRELNRNDLERMQIPDRYWRVSFNDITDSHRLSIGSTFRGLVEKYMRNMDEVIAEGAGLIFWGPNGTGKSSASVVIAKEFRRRMKTVLFMETADLKRTVIERDHFDENETFWDRAKGVDVLILDDFGKGIMDSTGFGSSLFDELVRSRNSHKRVTIITANLPIMDWRVELDVKESTLQALKECTVPIEVTGPNRRENSIKKLEALLT